MIQHSLNAEPLIKKKFSKFEIDNIFLIFRI